MTTNTKFDILLSEFTEKYLDVLRNRSGSGERTYGFEYEFLPKDPLSLSDMDRLYNFLSSRGFGRQGYESTSEENIRISFEPGGQIEYQSPPLTKNDVGIFESVVRFMDQTNAMIFEKLGVEYIGTGFIPGRGSAPLCLQSQRYIALHERLGRIGSRGHEMMKGTASIHLHVVISGLDILLPLFYRLCDLALHPDFKMSPERRDIWDHTDPVRCGIPPCCFDKPNSPEALIEKLIDFALHAEVLGEEVPFYRSQNPTFDAFLYHMTTLFTDVRFNLKGPTLELRTLDSIQTDQFHNKWNLFISLIENIGDVSGI